MLGGALIASGAHGCIFNNMPDCKTRRNVQNRNKSGSVLKRNNRTMKLAKLIPMDDLSVSVEIDNSSLLKHIPNYEDYFILIEDWCENMERPDGWQGCNLFKPGEQRVVRFMQLRMNYGGERLYEYAKDRSTLITNWLKIQIRVAEALRQLHIRGWVHGDIHHGNIIVDDHNIARLIDFGQSYSIAKLGFKDINLGFLPEYDNYAPELDYVAAVWSGINSVDAVHIIYTKKKLLRKIDEIFPSQQGVLGDLTLIANFNNITRESDVLAFIKRYAKAADIWTLGYNFLNLYMDLLLDPLYLRSEFYKRNHGEQMRVLHGMLHPDPRQRIDVDSLLKDLYSMRMLWV